MQLPAAFIQSIENCPGFSKTAFEAVHETSPRLTSVRMNPAKEFDMQHTPFITEKIPWSSNGFYLQQRPSFTLDPLFHAGAYYVQEASSMFLEEALKQTVDLSQSIKVLDLCAAPGGKSTLIQSVISDDSLLISNEVIKTRVNILSENTTKWGAANVIVTNNDAKDFKRLPGYFDAIIVDAPCSGSGLFRKDPEAITEWSLQNVALCSQRQQRILADVLPALKENGVLIYSTCSYSAAEDEEVADWLMEEYRLESINLAINKEWKIVETQSAKNKAYGYRFYPDKVKGEGFYITAFKKRQEDVKERLSVKKKNNTTEKPTAAEASIIKPFVKDAAAMFFFKQKDDVNAIPKVLEEDISLIKNSLYIKKAGVKLGSVIRNELIPDHELALSNIMSADVPFVEVNEATALQYLRKHDITIDTVLKGWVLIKFNELPLGWAKILPNRINNYYPREWRILNK